MDIQSSMLSFSCSSGFISPVIYLHRYILPLDWRHLASYTFLPALVLICPKMLEMCRASNAENIHWVLNHDVTDTTDIIPPKREVATSHVCYWQQSAIMHWHSFNASFYSMHKAWPTPMYGILLQTDVKHWWALQSNMYWFCLNMHKYMKCQAYPTKGTLSIVRLQSAIMLQLQTVCFSQAYIW